ncbi:rhodanese-like domain-containing protein [Novipirellula sp. SH528]|uniref:rhodanese-like domain-containing protein n=1 Tax=Novipirellula sp. SH528 TaxID=3454466 RepID=UPI003FA0855A
MPRFLPISVAILFLAGLPTILTARFGGLFAGFSSASELNVEQLLKIKAERAYRQHSIDTPHVIVDVREAEEYQVSMIPGAVTKTQFEKNKTQYRNHTIVVYCTIGYRSGLYANELVSDGFTAMNFKGSILAWCQAELPLVTMQGVQTNRVHTYSSKYKVPAKYTAVF